MLSIAPVAGGVLEGSAAILVPPYVSRSLAVGCAVSTHLQVADAAIASRATAAL
jgi:hypothetical protein